MAAARLLQRSTVLPRSAIILITMALSVFALTAQAKTAILPVTKSPHLQEIARHYKKLNYEAAIELLPKAATRAGNKAPVLLWLDLMEGVLHHGIKDGSAADVAFKRALERKPDATLPIKDPSQTLVARFEALRKAHLQELEAKKQPPPPTPAPAPAKISQWGLLAKLRELETAAEKWAKGPLPPRISAAFRSIYEQASKAQTPEERLALAKIIDVWISVFQSGDAAEVNYLADETAPARHEGPGQQPTSVSLGLETKRSALRRAISADVLHERIRHMREWLIIKSDKESLPKVQVLLSQLNDLHSELETSETAHERMLIAIRLDVLEVQMSHQLGWHIQGSTPTPLAIDKE
jgi:hypothetical protein